MNRTRGHLFSALCALAALNVAGVSIVGVGGAAAQEQSFDSRETTLPPPIEAYVPTQEAFDKGVAAYEAGDYAQAFEVWLSLAHKRDLAAMRNVGHLLRKGLGVERDPERALWFYEQAGDYGYPPAMVNAGQMLRTGDGVPADPKGAARWFYRAAKLGDANGMVLLARMLEAGEGVSRDAQAAEAYYRAASRLGHKAAIDEVFEIKAAPAEIGDEVEDGEKGTDTDGASAGPLPAPVDPNAP